MIPDRPVVKEHLQERECRFPSRPWRSTHLLIRLFTSAFHFGCGNRTRRNNIVITRDWRNRPCEITLTRIPRDGRPRPSFSALAIFEYRLFQASRNSHNWGLLYTNVPGILLFLPYHDKRASSAAKSDCRRRRSSADLIEGRAFIDIETVLYLPSRLTRIFVRMPGFIQASR